MLLMLSPHSFYSPQQTELPHVLEARSPAIGDSNSLWSQFHPVQYDFYILTGSPGESRIHSTKDTDDTMKEIQDNNTKSMQHWSLDCKYSIIRNSIHRNEPSLQGNTTQPGCLTYQVDNSFTNIPTSHDENHFLPRKTKNPAEMWPSRTGFIPLSCTNQVFKSDIIFVTENRGQNHLFMLTPAVQWWA